MDKGILSIKVMILGAVIFLAGWEFAYDSKELATLAFMAVGPALMLFGMLMGNRKEKTRDDKHESN